MYEKLKKLKKTINTIDNLEEQFKDEDIQVIFGLEEIKAEINEIIKGAE